MGGLALSEKGKEMEVIPTIADLWLHITLDQIILNWPNGGIVSGVLFQKGLFDSSPEKNTIDSVFNKFGRTIRRNISIGTTDADRNLFLPVDQQLSSSNAASWIMASSAIPGCFPYQTINYTNYIDGGSLYNIDFLEPINFCKRKGFEENDIIIDAIFDDAFQSFYVNCTNLTSMGMNQRATVLMQKMKKTYMLNDTFYLHPKIDFRYFVIPDQDFLNVLGIVHLDTNPKHLQAAYQLGYNDSLKEIKKKMNKN